MAVQGSVVVCVVCGTKMMIPPGYEHRSARCRQCNTPLTPNKSALAANGGISALAADLLDVAAPRTAPKPPSPATSKRTVVLASVRAGLLWGAVGAFIGAVCGAFIVVVLYLTTSTEHSQWHVMFVAATDFGILLGGIAGCIGGVVRRIEPSLAVSAAIGAAIGLYGSSTHHLAEEYYIAAPDTSLWVDSVIGLFAGAAVGIGVALYREYQENR